MSSSLSFSNGFSQYLLQVRWDCSIPVCQTGYYLSPSLTLMSSNNTSHQYHLLLQIVVVGYVHLKHINILQHHFRQPKAKALKDFNKPCSIGGYKWTKVKIAVRNLYQKIDSEKLDQILKPLGSKEWHTIVLKHSHFSSWAAGTWYYWRVVERITHNKPTLQDGGRSIITKTEIGNIWPQK